MIYVSMDWFEWLTVALLWAAIPASIALIIANVRWRRVRSALEGELTAKSKALVAQDEDEEHILYSISHDLRPALLDIGDQLEAAIKRVEAATKRGGTLDADLQSRLNRALKGVEWTRRFTGQLLALSRLRMRPTRNRADLVILAERAMGLLASAAEKRKIKLNIPPQRPLLPQVHVDREAWENVFTNLIKNGIEYGKEGGSVTISFAHKPPYIVITVADDGPGIPETVRTRILKQLLSDRPEEHSNVVGAGIGLWLVNRTVGMHGGTISFDSKLGEGTTFTIALPDRLTKPISEGMVVAE